jgi:hypothetical protein
MEQAINVQHTVTEQASTVLFPVCLIKHFRRKTWRKVGPQFRGVVFFFYLWALIDNSEHNAAKEISGPACDDVGEEMKKII